MILRNLLVWYLVFILLLPACTATETPGETHSKVPGKAQTEFLTTLQRHLDAVSNKDLDQLRSTMSPKGNMQLIMPGAEILTTADSFLLFHEQWFADTSWTFDTKILNTNVGDRIGVAVTEIMYREPERDGVPYFNRMIVSYVLERMEGQWYVIQDHASSVEKSTD